MTITDNARSVSEDWTGYVRRIDNSGPSISGPSSITDYHFTTTDQAVFLEMLTLQYLMLIILLILIVFRYILPNTYITTSGVSCKWKYL